MLSGMDQAGKKRARDFVLRHMGGMGVATLAFKAELDPATVRTFLRGETYPQTKKRKAIEAALGLPDGEIERAARGLVETAAGDPVEAAINASELSRGNKHTLIGMYYDMLDGQREVRGA